MLCGSIGSVLSKRDGVNDALIEIPNGNYFFEDNDERVNNCWNLGVSKPFKASKVDGNCVTLTVRTRTRNGHDNQYLVNVKASSQVELENDDGNIHGKNGGVIDSDRRPRGIQFKIPNGTWHLRASNVRITVNHDGTYDVVADLNNGNGGTNTDVKCPEGPFSYKGKDPWNYEMSNNFGEWKTERTQPGTSTEPVAPSKKITEQQFPNGTYFFGVDGGKTESGCGFLGMSEAWVDDKGNQCATICCELKTQDGKVTSLATMNAILSWDEKYNCLDGTFSPNQSRGDITPREIVYLVPNGSWHQTANNCKITKLKDSQYSIQANLWKGPHRTGDAKDLGSYSINDKPAESAWNQNYKNDNGNPIKA